MKRFFILILFSFITFHLYGLDQTIPGTDSSEPAEVQKNLVNFTAILGEFSGIILWATYIFQIIIVAHSCFLLRKKEYFGVALGVSLVIALETTLTFSDGEYRGVIVSTLSKLGIDSDNDTIVFYPGND